MTTIARRASLVLAPAVLALGIAACGESTDISKATTNFNTRLSQLGLKISCPKTVDGGEGTTFDCTISGPGGSQKVQMKVVKQGGNLAVDTNDKAQFKAALTKAAGQ